MLITAKKGEETFIRQTKTPRGATLGVFLLVNGELLRSGCCYLSSVAQSFAYVVANYIYQYGDKKSEEKFFHKIHLLPAGGSAAFIM